VGGNLGRSTAHLFLIGYAVAEEPAAAPERRIRWERWANGRRPHRRGRGRRLEADQRHSNIVVQLQGLHSGWGSSPYRFKYDGL
ncbi:MAG: hypothetical protein ACO2PN_02905, partial [Pyrobaculum sp.]